MKPPQAPASATPGAPAAGGPKVQNAIIPGPPPPPPPEFKGLPKPPPLPTGKPPPSAPASIAPPPGTQAAQDVPVQEELDPDEKRRQELMDDAGFARFVKLYKMKVPLLSILN